MNALRKLLGAAARRKSPVLSGHDKTAAASPSGSELPYAPGEVERLPKRKQVLRFAESGGVGVELGTFRGLFSEVLAETLKPTRLYLVDPWTKLGTHFPWRPDAAMTSKGKLTTAGAMNDTRERMARFSDMEVHLVEDYAMPFLTETAETFDWIYIDSSHNYQDTLDELRKGAEKLKPNGVIMGDDWVVNPSARHHGVFVAVTQFVKESDFEIIWAGPGLQWCLRREAPESRRYKS